MLQLARSQDDATTGCRDTMTLQSVPAPQYIVLVGE
jgi:hypothetical protein